jgi:excisionase family DNA binding protein
MLSVDQVAELFGKSSATIYRMAQKRQIPSIMLGGSRMFDPSTLALWLTNPTGSSPGFAGVAVTV